MQGIAARCCPFVEVIAKSLLLGQTTFLLHVDDLPGVIAQEMDKLIVTLIRGTRTRKWTYRDAIVASNASVENFAKVLISMVLARKSIALASSSGVTSLSFSIKFKTSLRTR